jgi:hypothetical protein
MPYNTLGLVGQFLPSFEEPVSVASCNELVVSPHHMPLARQGMRDTPIGHDARSREYH